MVTKEIDIIQKNKNEELKNIEIPVINTESIKNEKKIKVEPENEIKTDSRADLKAKEYAIESKLSNARSEKSANLPTITLDNTYTYYDPNYDNKSYQNNALEHQNIF